MMRFFHDRKIGFAAVVLVGWLALEAAPASSADSACRERLARVDAALEESSGLDPQMRAVLETMRNQAAELCGSGNETGAIASLQSVEMILSSAEQAASQKAAQAAERRASRARLTPEYLEGKWCSTQEGNQERGLWVFAEDGTYQVGPASSNYSLVSRGDMERFWQTFDTVVSKEADRFVLGRHHYRVTFERGQGACQPTAYRP